MPAAEAARVLAARFGVSARQARRYADQARASGRAEVPEASVVFTVKLPAALAGAAAYGLALWRAPGWMHATTPQEGYITPPTQWATSASTSP